MLRGLKEVESVWSVVVYPFFAYVYIGVYKEEPW